VLRIIDGDNVELNLDMGLKLHYEGFVGRLGGINCWEIGTEAGKAAKANLEQLILGKQVDVTTIKNDKYGGRYIIDLKFKDALGQWQGLAGYLVREQWAVLWNGRGPKPVPPWPRSVV
jgi:endonuclease YncB( thermonuclease family)